jgi:transcriptional regulator with XRE-family HTH domain
MDNSAAIFGRNLRRRREALGMTQTSMAGQTGMRQATLSEVEAGVANMTLRTMTRLAEAVGSDVAAMLTGEESVPGGTR